MSKTDYFIKTITVECYCWFFAHRAFDLKIPVQMSDFAVKVMQLTHEVSSDSGVRIY